MTSLKADPVTTFLSRFSLRDLGHFVVAYVATILPELNLTAIHVSKAALLAAIPAAAAVLFRQIFPHATVTSAEVGTAVANVEDALARVHAPATISAVLTQVGKVVQTAAADLPPVVLAGPAAVAPVTLAAPVVAAPLSETPTVDAVPIPEEIPDRAPTDPVV